MTPLHTPSINRDILNLNLLALTFELLVLPQEKGLCPASNAAMVISFSALSPQLRVAVPAAVSYDIDN